MDRKINFLQIFGILLVVLGHTGISGTFLFRWIYSFHMPLFMFISGYLFYISLNKNKEQFKTINIKREIKKKINRLLIPYLIISSLAFLPKFILNKYAVRPLEFNFKFFFKGFVYPTENPIIFFWFLPTLFIIMVFIMLILKQLKDVSGLLLITILITGIISRIYVHISILNISGCLNYMFFFVLGMYVKKNYLLISKVFKLKYIPYIIMLSSCLLMLILNIYTYNFGGIINSVYYYSIGTTGIMFSFCLAYFYELKDYSFFKKLYGTSYSIYLLSWFPQVFIRIVWFQIMKYNYVSGIILSFICGVFIPVIVNRFILKYFSKMKFIKIICGV